MVALTLREVTAADACTRASGRVGRWLGWKTGKTRLASRMSWFVSKKKERRPSVELGGITP